MLVSTLCIGPVMLDHVSHWCINTLCSPVYCQVVSSSSTIYSAACRSEARWHMLWAYLCFAALRSVFAVFQCVTVVLHVLDGLNHFLWALAHLPDGVRSLDQVSVPLPHHLPQLLFLLLDLPAYFPLHRADFIGAVSLKQHRRVLNIRHTKGLNRNRGHRCFP